jgi:HEAT repeat protein
MSAARSRPDAAEARLQALASLDPATDRATQTSAIGQALQDPGYRVVARAATLAGERSLQELEALLLAAWTRFLDDPVKRDPQCVAKAAIAAALLRLECDDVAFWSAGMRYRQLEPVWGTTTDTAVDVRSTCAMGLVNTGRGRAVIDLTELLNDGERRARAGAVRAIACGEPRQAEALLRFKVLVGDADPEVLGECFTALLAIEPDESIGLVASRLHDADEAVRDYAALALGESRQPQALQQLQAAWHDTRTPKDLRSVLARAIALHRTGPAFDWLIDMIEHGTDADADIAADALSVYDRNATLMQRMDTARAARPKA